MRILVVNQYFYPDLASSGQLLTELCIDLAADHDVTVVCGRPSYGAPASDDRPPAGIERVDIRRAWSTTFARNNMVGRLCNYATYLLSSSWRALTAPRPDAILTMTDPPIIAVVAATVGAVRRAPFVYVCQDIFPDIAVALGKLRDGPLRRGLAWLNRSLRRRASVTVAISDDMRARLLALGAPEGKIAVIPNWADGQAIRPGQGASFRSAHGWDGRFVVMHSGNIGLSQDLQTLVEAAYILRDRPEILFAIIGDGVSRPSLKAAAERGGLANVVFLDYQPKDRLSASLGAADIHVVSLKPGLEGFIVPSKVYGILAAGRPYIAAVAAGSEAARIAETSHCGLRINAGLPEALVEAVLAAQAGPLEAMGRAARVAFESAYDRPLAARAYRALLERVAQQHNAARTPSN